MAWGPRLSPPKWRTFAGVKRDQKPRPAPVSYFSASLTFTEERSSFVLLSFSPILVLNGRFDLKNVRWEEKDGLLVITVDLNQEQGKSASGKTTLIASTGKPQRMSPDKLVYIGLNVFKYPERG